MPPKPSPILGGFATQRSMNAADNDAVNLVVEVLETKDGKVPGYLFGMSGLDLVYSVGSGPIRGMLGLLDTLYAVSGDEVYSISANGTPTLLGTVNGIDGPVSMFQNTRQLMILDGIGAWLVPGGYPLTDGVSSGGSLYNVGDTIVLQATNGGDESAYPQIKITAISNNPVTSFALINAGTAYTGATGVGTIGIQPQQGNGSGLQLNITAVGGVITSSTGAAGGSGYAVGDTGTIAGGNSDGWYEVLALGGGGTVTNHRIINSGTGYSTATVNTTRGNPFPANVGSGFTVNTTASGGPITASSIDTGGQNYQAGNVGVVNGGSGDATYIVNAVGGNGVVTEFSIVAGGAIASPATSFTQQSTDGEGQNLTIQSPSFGTFLNLVPITLPFDDPVAGVVIDGFGLAVFLNQQVIAQSNQQDLSTWQTLAFGVANQSPDKVVTILSIHDEAFVFKERNTEFWANEGTSPFAFAPLQGVHISFGTVAPFSACKVDNELIWLSRNEAGQGVFLKATGYTPHIVSSQALTNELLKYSNIADCIAYSRQEGGHTYYVATFPSANVTWCYDKTSSELAGMPIWTKMAAFDNGQLNRHWGNCFTTFSGGLPPVTTTSSYEVASVEFSSATSLETTGGLVGLPAGFFTAVFSVWLDIPDGGGNTGITFGPVVSGNPGFKVTILNDATGTPQIVVRAFDSGGFSIVNGHYNFANWSNWVNVLISIDTQNQLLQVWANTITANVLVETQLTPTSLTWASSNAIGGGAANWELIVVTP